MLPHADDRHADELAAAARAVLACPAAVSLVVDSVPHALDGADDLALQDLRGTPTFLCPARSALADAGAARRSALLTVESGVGPPGSAERRDTLTLAGRLEVRERQECDCCAEVRDLVALELDFVLLARHHAHQDTHAVAEQRPESQHRVPLAEYRSPAHDLNRGYLQRSAEHANRCHQDELRRAVATMAGTPTREVVGVSLAHLTAAGVEVRWVDVTGAHSSVVAFPAPAADIAELGDLLRQQLHAGLC